MGYAFINFIDTKYIRMFYEDFNGKRWKKLVTNGKKINLDNFFFQF